MKTPRNIPIEFRRYQLDRGFPIVVLTGDIWKISDKPSGRLHFHNCLEIGICESDSGKLQLGTSVVPFRAGDITFVGTEVAHTTWSDSGLQSKWSYIYTDLAAMLGGFFPLSAITDEHSLREFGENCENILHGEDQPEIRSLALGIVHEMTQRSEGYEFAVRGLLLALLVRVLPVYRQQVPGDAAAGRVHAEADRAISIMPALRYIRAHYAEDFQMEYLAEICHMSPTSFRRIFASTMGTSPLTFLSETRIHRAAAMLRSTSDPILEIADRVGYQTLSSFNRHFQDIMGTSPRQYRKEGKEQNGRQVFLYEGWTVPEKL